MKLSDGYRPKSAVRSAMPVSLLSGVLLTTLVLVTLALTGCSQNESIPTSEQTASADQHLPFDRTSAKSGIFPTGSLAPTAIPVGTQLAVHLRTSLSSATARAGDSFEATLDDPVYVRGRLVAARGAMVTGKVMDARAAGELQEAGYLRLALTAISFNGQSIAMQTSSIFVKRGAHTKRNLNEVIGAATNDQPTTDPSIGKAPIGKASISKASISNAGMSRAAITEASITKTSLSRKSNGSLDGNGSGTLIGASAGAAGPAFETDYATENKDVGVAPGRRLIFRLAQPITLEM